ncbi:hypothetical protein F4861DRAFT_491539 [Xylaria intraflava]|nr:hypothetical protein F4861DRAFT_491539 [Xylaria intraflava]
MRWPSRFNLKGPAQGARSLVSHANGRILFTRFPGYPRVANPVLTTYGLCSSSGLRAKTTSSASSTPTRSADSGHAQGSNAQGLRWSILALIFTASAAMTYLYRRRSSAADDDVINTSTFGAFTIIKREQVSPSAFIVTLRPRAWVTPEALECGRESEDNGPSGFLSARIREAWRHGLWSVEIKQPQLQIARHYTPLPPLRTPARSSSAEESSGAGSGTVDGLQAVSRNENAALEHEDDDEQADLRILIRKMDGGEMSNYLARQRVGDTVWLRGPHLGFDVARRLGTLDDGHDGDVSIGEDGSRKGVVFLAGGTGIAPALQIAHKLLDGHDSSRSGQNKPYVSILWANRFGADALGREQHPPDHQQKLSRWPKFWASKTTDPSTNPQDKREYLDPEPVSSLAVQIEDLKRRHRSHFELSYFVDNEGTFIGPSDLQAACASISPSPRQGAKAHSSSFARIDKDCTWHSAKAVELLPDHDDAARSSSDSAYACTCTPKPGAKMTLGGPGVNLLCVSGPDGFIEAYAGAKRWDEGNEMQGAVSGLIGRLQRDKGGKLAEWLVLKL